MIWDGLKLNDAAVETEFVITVPFLGYFSAVLEGLSPHPVGMGPPALQQFLVGSFREDHLHTVRVARVHSEHLYFGAFRCVLGGEFAIVGYRRYRCFDLLKNYPICLAVGPS